LVGACTGRFGELGAPQDTVDKFGRAVKQIVVVGAVGYQAAAGGNIGVCVNRRQAMAGGKRGDRFAVGGHQSAGDDDHSDSRRPREGFNAARNLTGSN